MWCHIDASFWLANDYLERRKKGFVQKIFIGDVQGCGDELENLVTRARQEFDRDFELWSVGDMINRGPKNLLALGLMRELCEQGQGQFVLGNHEIGLLRVWLGLVEVDPKNTYPEILDDPSCRDWIDWIRRQPVGLTGTVEDKGFAMVHASLHPDWSLEGFAVKARRVEARLAATNLDDVCAFLDPNLDSNDTSLIEDRDTLGRLTRCRSVDSGDEWSSAQPGDASRPWHEAWLERQHAFGVVYGHWAIQGLHVDDGIRGLDTGCVHHGRGRDGYLTAWLPGSDSARAASLDEFAAPDDRIWQIPALRRYYD